MVKLQVLNLQATTKVAPVALAPRLGDLSGKAIGLYWNLKAGGDVALDRTAQSLDAMELMNRQFLEWRWSDGPPLVPPTPVRVERILSGANKAPEEVVARLEPGFGMVTVEKVAANAVIAGTVDHSFVHKSEQLPLLLQLATPFRCPLATGSWGGEPIPTTGPSAVPMNSAHNLSPM